MTGNPNYKTKLNVPKLPNRSFYDLLQALLNRVGHLRADLSGRVLEVRSVLAHVIHLGGHAPDRPYLSSCLAVAVCGCVGNGGGDDNGDEW